MRNHNIKAIIFDLGNVLIDFDHTRAATRISAFCAKTPDEIYRLFFDSEATALFEAGRITPQDFYLKVKEMLDLKLDYEGFLPVWNEIFFLSPKNDQVHELAGRLKGRYKLALLSNINTLHFDYLKKNFPVFDAFHKVIASCDTGFIKPDPKIYQIALDSLGVSADETFYTDDRLELIESAQKLGLKSFIFTDSQKLKSDLLGEGVDIN
ncbi:MAG: HAD family phosphatase [Candidatus Omnitrophica bacterium]|nr:HAD family phosphatase [Candidatus Omnitrophota bacterium]